MKLVLQGVTIKFADSFYFVVLATLKRVTSCYTYNDCILFINSLHCLKFFLHFWFEYITAILQVLFDVATMETDLDFEEQVAVMKFLVKAWGGGGTKKL